MKKHFYTTYQEAFELLTRGSYIVDGDVSFDRRNKFALVERMMIQPPSPESLGRILRKPKQVEEELRYFFDRFNETHGYEILNYGFIDTVDAATLQRFKQDFNFSVFNC